MIKQLIAQYLADQPLPFKYTSADLARQIPCNPGAEYKRRHRELRDLGWTILTYREDPALGHKEYLLTTVGAMP